MNHRHKRRRTISKFKKKFRNLAAAIAGATILSGAMLPGVPPAVAQAAANPDSQIALSQQSEQVTLPSGDKIVLDNKNAPSQFEQVLTATATAYAPGPHDNDQWGDKTFTGEQIRPGIIAVDPDVIPLGSRVYIEYPDGHGEYAVAADTGGAIKGNRIDVAKWTVKEAKKFGVKKVKVYILSSPKSV